MIKQSNERSIGTCRHAQQVQEMWRIPLHAQPHERAERIEWPEVYTCGWRPEGGLPPPIARWASGDLRAGDCACCPHYEAAGLLLERILAGKAG